MCQNTPYLKCVFMARLNADTLVMFLMATGKHAILVVLPRRKLSLRILFWYEVRQARRSSQIGTCRGQ